jgi:hypothetical protein
MIEIKIKNKYFLFKRNLKNDKIVKVSKGNTKEELYKSIKEKTFKDENEFLVMTFEIKKDWTPETKIPINMLGGPIKITFSFLTHNLKNKEDPRAIQIIYYTYDFYVKNKIKIADLLKLSKLAFENKLEKRLLAAKLITQIVSKF